jgi:aspartate racemase
MKTIGLLGGMSWESTALYYRGLNEGVKRALGGHHSAKIVLVSVDFEEIKQHQYAGRWDEAGEALAAAAQQVQAGGADFLLIGTNTMHKVYDRIAAAVRIPVLHLADATGERIVAAGHRRVGLLATGFTMAQDFYKGRLADRHGLEVLVPDAAGQKLVHDVIYDELCLGAVRDESRARYLEEIEKLRARGATALIEGCTEITMLVRPEHTTLPLFDTTAIHVEEAVRLALAP